MLLPMFLFSGKILPENEEGQSERKKGMSLEEDIQFTQNQIPELLKRLKLENKNEIILDMGPVHKIADRTVYLFVRKVNYKLSGDQMSELQFSYMETDENSIYKETRQFINKSPSDKECKGLSIVYSNSKGERNEALVTEIKDTAQKYKVMRLYLSDLNDLVRWLTFYGNKGDIQQKKKIQKALSVGSV